MDGSSPPNFIKDRLFDPSRMPITDRSRELIAEALHRLHCSDRRLRRRRVADQQRYETAVTALVSDVVHRHLTDPDGWLMLEMSKVSLSAKKRRAAFMTEQFPTWVKALSGVSVGIVQLRLGRHTPFGGERSTVLAAPWLQERVEELDLSLRDFTRDPCSAGDPIVLRGTKFAGKAKDLVLPDTDEVRRLRSEVEEINEWLFSADLDWYGENQIDVNNRRLRRIFNNASFGLGGRLYGGFWQAVSGAERLDHIRIDGEPVASIDFAQVGVHMACGTVGAKPPSGDLYNVPGTGGSREGVKQVLNALLASDVVPRRFPAGTKALFPKGRKFAGILEAIEQFHAPIAPLFGTAQALKHMNLESRVIVSVLLHLKWMGIVALPIHDCILVKADHSAITQEIMESTFEHFAGVGAGTTVECS